MTSARNEVGGWFGATPISEAAEQVQAPPAEGRPYPNLASVPKPPIVTPPAERQQELERLSKDRAGARAAPPASPPVNQSGSDLIGTLSTPAGTAFSDADRLVLRQAISQAARHSPGIIRLVGAPDATALVASELSQMGLPPQRARSQAADSGRRVEIFVDY